MDDPQITDNPRSPLRNVVQGMLILGMIVTLFGIYLLAAFGAPVGLLAIVGIQAVGLLAIALHMRRETRPRIIGLYFVIALGFYLMMFGLCISVG